MYHIEHVADRTGSSYGFANMALDVKDSWSDDDLKRDQEEVEFHRAEIEQSFRQYTINFDSMSPESQEAVTLWLGEVFYNSAHRYKRDQYRFSQEKGNFSRATHRLPDFNETVEDYVKNHHEEKPTTELKREFYLQTGNKVLSAFGLKRPHAQLR